MQGGYVMKSLVSWTLVVWLSLVCCLPVYAANCKITATALAFGTFSAPNPADVDSTANLTVSCKGPPRGASPTTPFTVSLSQGTGGSFNPRTMTTGIYTLNYNLYTDATRLIIWGDGTPGTILVAGNAQNNTNLILTVYGRIPANQNLFAGIYNDTITVTVTY